MSYSGPAPASPLHWRLICLARCLCTLLLLVTFWCHGVTMKWLPSHVAARGGTTSGTMKSRWVGAGTQEAPAGRNALTLPPPWLPWNRELVEALLTTSQCLCVPGSSQGLARTRGEERQRHRHSDQGMGALRVIGGNLYILLWPLTQAEIKLSLTHGTVGECLSLAGLAWVSEKPYCHVVVYNHSKWMIHFSYGNVCAHGVYMRQQRKLFTVLAQSHQSLLWSVGWR